MAQFDACERGTPGKPLEVIGQEESQSISMQKHVPTRTAMNFRALAQTIAPTPEV